MKQLLIALIFLTFFGCSNQSLKNDDSIKVMTYNIKYDNPNDSKKNWKDRKPLVAEIIKLENPDIIGFQEVLKNQIDDLTKLLPDYFWIGVGRDDGIDEGEFSPVFYKKSRFTKYDSQNFWLSETPDSVSFGWDAACRRICTWGKFKDNISGKIFLVFNTHFDHQGKTAQVESAKLLARKIYVKSEKFPFVLLGDFNVNSNSEAYKKITTGVDFFKITNSKEISKTKPSGDRTTFNGFNNNYEKSDAIDHIFVRNRTTVLNHKTIAKKFDGKFPSDHFPVVITLKFNKTL